MTTERMTPRRRDALFWSVLAIALASLFTNAALGFRIASTPDESLLLSQPTRQSDRQLAQSGYRVIRSPHPPVDVPGVHELEHKPLLLIYESGGMQGYLPVLVLYEDGLVLTARRFAVFDGATQLMSLKGHIPAELGQRFVRERFAAFGTVPERVDLYWRSWGPAPRSFDRPQLEVFLRDGSRWMHAQVDDLSMSCKRELEPCGAPQEIQIIYEWATRLDLPDATRWHGDDLPSAEYIRRVQQAIHAGPPHVAPRPSGATSTEADHESR